MRTTTRGGKKKIYCCHDKRAEPRDEEAPSNDREAVLQMRKRRGFMHLPSAEREGIIDESAACNFSVQNKKNK